MDNNSEIVEIVNEQPVEETAPAVAEERPKLPRRHIGAALLGFAQTLLSLVGVVAILWSAIGGIVNMVDTSDLHEEFYYFLEPVLVYPAEFKNVNDVEEDAFLNAAAFRLMQAEQIRMLREKDDTPIYPVDDNGRIAIETKEITESYRVLFGKKAKFTHRSIADSGLEYSEEDDCCYVPFEVPQTGSRAMVFSSKRTLSGYEVKVGYVPEKSILLDEHGNELPPTEDMATHFQIYTLKKSGDSYYITSCKSK